MGELVIYPAATLRPGIQLWLQNLSSTRPEFCGIAYQYNIRSSQEETEARKRVFENYLQISHILTVIEF